FHKAKQEFLRKKDEKRKAKEQILKAKAEKEEALKKYKEKRLRTYKTLSKKTKKGQPVMKDRMEMLLEKIQQQVSS
ncbi:thyroid transcription factor 1-associated protein 26 homolog, partial [Ceratina calcarata]|uniref:Thyroid transcription factor 1-associated protein 26 homolog n=1 Tax=Ceratina calcarata TaxID=156304 RepID=A0AAJ7IV81_9HYME